MEEARLGIREQRKPRIIFDKRFPYINGLDVKDKGQLQANIIVNSERLEMNEDGNEYKILTLEVIEIEPIENKDRRVI